LRTLGYSDSSALLAWALLAGYAVVFLLIAAFIFRRQEAQA
jgi:ABC-type transport system involved in multi-copper enzyme maturation permease subunit